MYSAFGFLKAVRDDTRLDRAAKDVAWVLVTYADKNGECFPSVGKIMTSAGINSKNTVIAGRKTLEQFGYMKFEEVFADSGYQRCNKYRLIGGSTIEQGGSMIERGSSTIEHREFNDYTPGGSTIEHKQSIEQSIEQKKVAPKRSSVFVPEEVGTSIPSDLYEDFMKVRKAKRAPMTERAWNGIKREAGKAGWSLEAVLQKCIERNWQGFEAGWVAKEPKPVVSKSVPLKSHPTETVQDEVPVDTGTW